MKQRLVYGPVPSRRLGLSLGVDLVPLKVCSYDCIYCQLGRTKQRTVERKPYIPAKEILVQVREKLEEGINLDYITLAGSGEPTLNTEIGPLIHEIKQLTQTPVAVLTNSSLLGSRQVRESLMEADAVLPSLDAHDEEGFQTINRPHSEIRFEAVLEGLFTFSTEYRGNIWLEVFILDGINATPTDATQFKQHIEKVNPQKIHINTAVRPTAEAYARQVPSERMTSFCSVLERTAEVIAPFREIQRHEGRRGVEEDLLSLLSRRPCTLDDISSGLNMNGNKILKRLDVLVEDNTIETIEKDSVIYYQPKKQP